MYGGSTSDRRVLSEDLTQRSRSQPGEALPDEVTGGVVDFDRFTPDELASRLRHPSGEERFAPAHNRCNRPIIHGQNAYGRQAEGLSLIHI